MGKWEFVKTIIEIPDTLFRKAKAKAAEHGVPLKDLFSDAVRQYLQRSADSAKSKPSVPVWMSAFGGLRDLRKETQRINRVLEEEFEQVEEHEWR